MKNYDFPYPTIQLLRQARLFKDPIVSFLSRGKKGASILFTLIANCCKANRLFMEVPRRFLIPLGIH